MQKMQKMQTKRKQNTEKHLCCPRCAHLHHTNESVEWWAKKTNVGDDGVIGKFRGKENTNIHFSIWVWNFYLCASNNINTTAQKSQKTLKTVATARHMVFHTWLPKKDDENFFCHTPTKNIIIFVYSQDYAGLHIRVFMQACAGSCNKMPCCTEQTGWRGHWKVWVS